MAAWGPVSLSGRSVRIEPLSLDHAPGLFAAGNDEVIWRYLPHHQPKTVGEMEDWIGAALESQVRNQRYPHVIIDVSTGSVAGSTSYLDPSEADRHIEIGYTWLGCAYWRTPINTECKYLLLRHAFEELRCIRVQLKTDIRNERSQRAIERIGGVREGALRKVIIVKDGYHRTTVFFSILDDEWPTVKFNLEERMGL